MKNSVLFLTITPTISSTKAIKKLFNLEKKLSFQGGHVLAFNAFFFDSSSKRLKPQTKNKIAHLDFFLLLLFRSNYLPYASIRSVSNLFKYRNFNIFRIRWLYNNKCKQLVSGQTLCFKTTKKTRSLINSFKTSKTSFKKNYLLKSILFTLKLMTLSVTYAKRFNTFKVLSNKTALALYYTVFKFIFDFKNSLSYLYLKLQLKILKGYRQKNK